MFLNLNYSFPAHQGSAHNKLKILKLYKLNQEIVVFITRRKVIVFGAQLS